MGLSSRILRRPPSRQESAASNRRCSQIRLDTFPVRRSRRHYGRPTGRPCFACLTSRESVTRPRRSCTASYQISTCSAHRCSRPHGILSLTSETETTAAPDMEYPLNEYVEDAEQNRIRRQSPLGRLSGASLRKAGSQSVTERRHNEAQRVVTSCGVRDIQCGGS